MDKDEANSICADLPSHLSAFVDTFVDFSVSGGLFLLPPTTTTTTTTTPRPTTARYPSPDRLVAIGDLHGDLDKSKQAFRIAGLIDPSNDRWIGGNTTVVQIGDVFDRGGDELKILYFLEKLKREASRCGGSIITMIGNHETMNVDGDFRFVTPSALHEFRLWAEWFGVGVSMKSFCVGCCSCSESESEPGGGGVDIDIFRGIPESFPGVRKEFHEGFRARMAALRPNGPISTRFLSGNPTALVVGDSVFVHGGLLQDHVSYGLQRINEEVSDWINGLKGRHPPHFVRGRNAVVWLRKFSDDRECDCSTLQHVLATIPGAKRMIMGHTIQDMGINGACDNRAIRIDVGMSKGCGDGLPQVLEILGNSDPRVLTTKPLYNGSIQYKDSSSLKHNNVEKESLGLFIPQDAPKPIQVQA